LVTRTVILANNPALPDPGLDGQGEVTDMANNRPMPDASALSNLPYLPDRNAHRRGPRPGVTVPRVLEDQIVVNILDGATPRAAAVAVGLPAQTFDEWMRRGRRHDDRPATPRLVRFAERIDRATATAQVGAEKEVRKSQLLEWLRAAARDVWTDRRALAVAPGPPEDVEVRIVYVNPKRERQMAEAIARSPDASLALNTILDAAFPEETGTTAPAEGD